jgi:PKD repeat protein
MDFPPENQQPRADFRASCTSLDCVFDARASYDPDGNIVSYRWNFGDGNTGSGDTVAHRYAASGSYPVSLTVADNAGATGIRSKTISVTTEPPPGFNLTATKSLGRGGRHRVHLQWTGATSTHVNVYRNRRRVTATPNDGSHTDVTGRRGRATYTYWVCERGTSTCSNEATVAFK